MKLFEVTNTTWENLQIATHKSVSFTPHIVLICVLQFKLQIFSGCVCHLEQLHAQSPFLFPIVFSLIPFFDICSVFAVISPGLFGYVLLYLGHCTVATVAVCGLAAGLWCLTAGCHVKSPLFPQPPLKQKCARAPTMGESIRPSSLHNPTPSAKKHVVQICRSSLSAAMQTVQVSVEPHLSQCCQALLSHLRTARCQICVF